jgi:hypothetical protein
MTDQEKLNTILRHIKKVEDNCNLLARKMYDSDPEWSRDLILRGRLHDSSKLIGYEFKNLWTESPKFNIALGVHREGNRHHPEFFREDGIHGMTSLDVAEMVCDCLARSQEFGTDIRKWFFGNTEQDAPFKYKYTNKDDVWRLMEKYLNLLLTPSFGK